MLTNINFAEISDDIKSGSISLQTFVNETCDRIDQYDSIIHSLVPEQNRRSRLLNEAKELEKRFPNPEDRPPLYGMLIGIKDNLRVEDMPTKAGSQLPEHLFEGPETRAVTLLRDAGALILGKTVTTEFAYREPGPTVNPHNMEHTPGGSSSGSAVSVAAGFCSIALGTQTAGSIIRPAAFCGVIGFKPSFDRIPTNGILHYSKTMDHIGILGQKVEDVYLVSSILCKDWISQEEYTSTLPILGVPEGPYLDQVSSESLALFELQLNRLSKAGYVINRISVLEEFDRINKLHRELISYEMAEEHAEWFKQYKSLYRPRTKDIILKGQNASTDTIIEAKKAKVDLRKKLEDIMEQHGVDLWVCPPALGPAPKGIQSTGDAIMNLPWTNTGMPAINIPVEKTPKGLPIGLQFVASYMNDEQLIKWSNSLFNLFNNS